MIKSVAIQIDLEKYSALKMYIEQKNTSIESELEKFTEQLYQKYVPQNVRDFINMKARIMPTNKSTGNDECYVYSSVKIKCIP